MTDKPGSWKRLGAGLFAVPISFINFKKGEKYLVVGPSGGGKSTLLKLLRKYFNPAGGEILGSHSQGSIGRGRHDISRRSLPKFGKGSVGIGVCS
ncbi:MAG: ATP-binding cassette domain-containing protein [Clostridiales bacterium]|nr:ATP-binding cassette domain-containing protein [Clostridiales bacterium]